MTKTASVDEKMIVHSEMPFSAEPALTQLDVDLVKPQSFFDSHGNISALHTSHRLKITKPAKSRRS